MGALESNRLYKSTTTPKRQRRQGYRRWEGNSHRMPKPRHPNAAQPEALTAGLRHRELETQWGLR